MYVQRERIYYNCVGFIVNTEAKKVHDLLSISWRPRKVGVVDQTESQPENQMTGCHTLRPGED